MTFVVSGRQFHEMQGEMGITPVICLFAQMHSLPFHCLAQCHGADLVNLLSYLFLPTLFQVGSANGKHQQEVGGQQEG